MTEPGGAIIAMARLCVTWSVGGRSFCCRTVNQRQQRPGCEEVPKSRLLFATEVVLTGWRPQRRYLMPYRSLIDGI